VQWFTGTPDAYGNTDGFQSSPTYSIGPNNPTYQTYGPWSLTVANGSAGVTEVGPNLFLDLTAVLDCGNAAGGQGVFALTDIEMTPVSAVAKARSLEAVEHERLSANEIRGRSIDGLGQLTAYPLGELVASTYIAKSANLTR